MTDDNQVVSATFLAGNISVSLSDDNIVTMKGQLLASDTILYNVNMSGKFKKEGLSYDAENGPVNREYTNSEIEFDTKTKGRSKEKNCIGLWKWKAGNDFDVESIE